MAMNITDFFVEKTPPLLLISGPCVIENYDVTIEVAAHLKQLSEDLGIPFLFKASYDKANRTSIDSYRGPGLVKGLEILARIKSELDIQIISDVHRIREVAEAAQVLDVIQIPAFLCRQTDFILEVGRSNKPVNIKKGQFVAPMDMQNVVAKIRSTGNQQIMLTDRGTVFGYNNLVVDMRGIPMMQQTGCPVIFDATHSVQLPGGQGSSSGGQREFAPVLARAAIAAGANGVFLEVHPDPDNALCDGPNSLKLSDVAKLIKQLIALHALVASESQEFYV